MLFEYDRDKGIKQISSYRLSQLRMHAISALKQLCPD